jgi:hypothetical protein
MTSMDLDALASILRGYLQSLRRMSGNRCDFWSYAIDMDGDIEDSIDSIIADTDTMISVRVPAGYKEVDVLLDRYVFPMLNVADEQLFKLFAWDIVEYIDLCCWELDPATTPLSRREAMVFEGSSSFHPTLAYLVVPIKSRALVIALGTRA